MDDNAMVTSNRTAQEWFMRYSGPLILRVCG
jgi:hypothetical protein